MSKLLNNKQELANRFPTLPHISPLPTWFIMKHLALQEELKLTKQRLLELESSISGEEAIVIREITREEAKQEIRQLFKSGRTLYYSDIARELKLDLELVVEICNELQESGLVEVDARVS
ncbi:MAG: hypothetical protein ISS58_05485 [Dehalococcoidales bacterium]|nr:hypothetical protein [Dehalococcoidales bacterium]